METYTEEIHKSVQRILFSMICYVHTLRYTALIKHVNCCQAQIFADFIDNLRSWVPTVLYSRWKWTFRGQNFDDTKWLDRNKEEQEVWRK